jgi:SAM-dependent methyltransferase
MHPYLPDLYDIFLGLLLQPKRTEALNKLKCVIPPESCAAIETILSTPRSSPEYQTRHNTIALTGMAIDLLKHLMDREMNVFSPKYIEKHILKRNLQFLQTVKPNATFHGKDILEMGAGRRNPLGLSCWYLLYGAKGTVAYEPTVIDPRYARFSIEAFLQYAAVDCPWLKESVHGRENLAQFVRTLDLTVLESGQGKIADKLYLHSGLVLDFEKNKNSFDYIFSNAVLEHVMSPHKDLAAIHTALRPGGVAIHVVDLSDHLFLPDDPLHKFRKGNFQPGGINNLNGLRLYDFIKLFQKLRLPYKILDTVHSPLTDMDLESIRQYCPDAPPETLDVSQVVFAVSPGV